MSTRFAIGQRVRVVYVFQVANRYLIGKVGTVERYMHSSAFGDEYHLSISGGFYLPGQLEPATDSYDKASWDDCVWKPEHLRINA